MPICWHYRGYEEKCARGVWTQTCEQLWGWANSGPAGTFGNSYLPCPFSLNCLSKVLWGTLNSSKGPKGSWIEGWGVEGLAHARGSQVQPQSSFPDLMFGHDCLTLGPLSQEYVLELLKGCVSSLYLYQGIRQKDSPIEWWRKPRHVFLVAKSHSQLPEIAPSLPPFCWCITS